MVGAFEIEPMDGQARALRYNREVTGFDGGSLCSCSVRISHARIAFSPPSYLFDSMQSFRLQQAKFPIDRFGPLIAVGPSLDQSQLSFDLSVDHLDVQIRLFGDHRQVRVVAVDN